MNVSEATDLARDAVLLALTLGAPVLLTGLIVGLIVGIMQAATQVQDQVLSFVPKIFAMLLATLLMGPWILSRLVAFAGRMFTLP